MSVPKSKQGLAEMQYFKNAKKFISVFTSMNLRKFGVTAPLEEFWVKNPTKENMENHILLGNIIAEESEDEIKVVSQYPEWIWDKLRELTFDNAWTAYLYIVSANAHYPNSAEEAAARRNDISLAIATYTSMCNGLQWMTSVLPIDKDKLAPYIELIGKQIYLLKLWRRGINKIYSAAVANSKK